MSFEVILTSVTSSWTPAQKRERLVLGIAYIHAYLRFVYKQKKYIFNTKSEPKTNQNLNMN